MSDKIRVMWKEDFPEEEYQWHYKPNHHNQIEAKKGYKAMIKGHCVQYNPETRERSLPILDDNFPGRDILFEEEIFTVKQAKQNLDSLKEIDGIGPKTYSDIKEFLDAKRVMNQREKATKTDSTNTDSNKFEN